MHRFSVPRFRRIPLPRLGLPMLLLLWIAAAGCNPPPRIATSETRENQAAGSDVSNSSNRPSSPPTDNSSPPADGEASASHEPETEVAVESPATDLEENNVATADPETDRYEIREFHDPDGIGKFYMGREIAHVVGGAQTVNWLERDDREKEEAITTMVSELKLKPGMIAADIGAGSGTITRLMAPHVLPEGRVVALDVQQEMLDILAGKLKLAKIDNVDLLLGTSKSPRLPKESLDLAVMVDVYHEFEFPYEMMRGISQAIKPGGRVVFVEYRLEDPDVPIKLVHKMSQDQVKKEMSLPEFRLKWKETIDVLPRQHMIVFEKRTDKAGP